MDFIRTIAKAIRYATVKYGINGILFFVILFQICFLPYRVNRVKDEYRFAVDYEVLSAGISEMKNTYEHTKYIDDIYLDDDSVVYRVNIEVANYGKWDLNTTYSLSTMTFKGDDKESYPKFFAEYYNGFEDSEKPNTNVIPPGETCDVTYYIVVDKEEIPDDIYIYDLEGKVRHGVVQVP